jgi:hypothetical protein
MRTSAIWLALCLAACGSPPPGNGDGGQDGGGEDGGGSLDGGDGGAAGDGGTVDGGGDGGSGSGDAGSDAGLPAGTCGDPIPLVFTGGGDGGTAFTGGDTLASTTDNAVSACGGFSTNDVVYRITTSRLLNLRANLSTSTGTYRPVLELQGVCGSPSSLSCGAGDAGGPASLMAGSLAPGTYFLVVDGSSGTGGQYTLDAALEPPDAGDACQTAFPLTFSGGTAGGVATASGSTVGLFDDGSDLCGGSVEPDVAYQFTTSQPLNFQVDVTPSAGYRPVAYVWTAASCGGLGTVTYGCASAPAAGQVATYQQGSLPAGSYLLWIDGASGTSGNYSFTASLAAPPQGDDCPNPFPLVFSGGTDGGTASASGDTSAMFNQSFGSCGGNGARDAVYTFTVDRQRTITATVTPTGSGYRPVVYLQRGTCAIGGEILCKAAAAVGGSATVSGTVVPATYYLWVDGVSTAGGYQLTVDLP